MKKSELKELISMISEEVDSINQTKMDRSCEKSRLNEDWVTTISHTAGEMVSSLLSLFVINAITGATIKRKALDINFFKFGVNFQILKKIAPEDEVAEKIKTAEEENNDYRGLAQYIAIRTRKLAEKDSEVKAALENNDLYALVSLVFEQLATPALQTEDDIRWANIMKKYQDNHLIDPNKTTNLLLRVIKHYVDEFERDPNTGEVKWKEKDKINPPLEKEPDRKAPTEEPPQKEKKTGIKDRLLKMLKLKKKPTSENMKKTELKALLKVITEEVIAAKQERLNETKGLSGFKKSKESTEHTEKLADSKDLTGPAPKEKQEGKKLPVVKKPANPQKVGSIKEEIIQMIREEIEEAMGRPKLGGSGAEADANTVEAIEGILQANPTAKDIDIIKDLANRAREEGEVLNLDKAFVQQQISSARANISKETGSGAEDAPEGELAAMASAEEKRKAAQRAAWIKKLQAKRGMK